MFGIKKLAERVAVLESNAEKERLRRNCVDGYHEWEIRDAFSKEPFIRCKHCCVKRTEKK